jgi:deoxyribose-phosphate aldolase
MDLRDLRARLHQTALRPELLPAEVHKLVTDAMQNGLGAVVVPPVWVKRVATMLQGIGVRTETIVGFPHGTNKSTVKAIEATSCIKDGAEAVHVVAYLPNLIRRDVDAAKHELLEIARAARAARRDVMINVILETAVLLRANAGDVAPTFAAACRAAREGACDGVVTGTGFHPAGGATVEAVKLLREAAEGLTITAVGGVDSAENAAEIVRAGADVGWSERAAAIVVEWARG